MRRTHRPRRAAGREELRRFPDRERHARFDERRVHVLAESGAMTMLERREDTDGREEARAEIRQRHARLHRRAAAIARDRHDPRHALRNEIEAALRPIGSGLSVSRYRRVDEPRVDGRQRLVIEAERRDHAGPVILDEDVARARDPLQRVASFRRFEVDDGAALPAVDGVEAGTLEADSPGHLTRRITAGRLDLDDVGAEVREEHRAVRTRHDLRDVEHPKAVERTTCKIRSAAIAVRHVPFCT